MRRVDSRYIHLDGRLGMRLFGAADPLVRLLCFSPIGGNSSHFSRLARYLPAAWQLCAVDPPGHGQVRGSLLVDFDALISIYLENLAPWLTGESYIFGHSLGGLIGYVLTQKLEKELHIAGIFISSTAPPNRVVEENTNGHDRPISDKEIDDYMQNIDPRFAQLAKSFLFMYVKPVFKADYKVFKSFRFDHLEKVKTPLYIMYSPNDIMVDPLEIKEWRTFGHSAQFIEIPGNHDNFVTHSDIVMGEIKNCIAANGKPH